MHHIMAELKKLLFSGGAAYIGYQIGKKHHYDTLKKHSCGDH